ncbi:MAG: methyltransferase domain-containing protein [Alphaproteobacteria bacterium]|nr:methyltransferase domain-containing protein [Alphaproteobacteria bacterium]
MNQAPTNSEVDTPDTTANAVAFMARRRAATHASFLLPDLRPGMRVLEVGCGPGSITLDLARAVMPGGGVVGVDQSGEQFHDIAEVARRDGIPAHLEIDSVNGLPFPDTHFDAVVAHAHCEHLAEPRRALEELRRVLAPGGRIGLCSPDWGGFFLYPDSPELYAAVARYEALLRTNGGDTHAGRKLAARLRNAAFIDLNRGAGFEIYSDKTLIGDYLAAQVQRAGEAAHAAVLRHWAGLPDAMFAQAWLHTIATRPSLGKPQAISIGVERTGIPSRNEGRAEQ